MSQNDYFNSLLRLTLEYASEAGYKLEKANLDLQNLQTKFNLLQNKMNKDQTKIWMNGIVMYDSECKNPCCNSKKADIDNESSDGDSDNVPTNGFDYEDVDYVPSNEFDYESSEEVSKQEQIKKELETVKALLENLKQKGVKFRNLKSFWAQLNSKIEGKKQKRKTRSKKLKRAYKILSGGNKLPNPVTKSD